MVFLIVVFVIFLLTQRRIKDSISKLFIWSFFLLWLLQSVLSRFGFYDNLIPKDNTYSLVAIHLLSFYLGFVCIKIKRLFNGKMQQNDILDNIKYGVETLSRNPFFVVILILSFLYVISILEKFIGAILFAQSISDARADGQLQELYGQGYYYINMIVLTPLCTLVTFLFSFKTFEKRDLLWVLMGLFLIMYKSLGGGRLGYLSILIGVVFVGIYLQEKSLKERNFFKRYKRFFVMAGLAVVFYVIIGFVTAGRSGDVSMSRDAFTDNQETTNEHFYNYYVCPLIAFDYTVNNGLVEKQGGYHYGGLTFNCVEEAFYVVFHRIGINYNRPIGQYAELYQDNYINVGSMNWNALYTWCNYFYCDFGIIGLIFFPFIIGMLIRLLVRYYYSSRNVYSGALLTLAYYNIALSMVSFYFNGFASFLIICVLLYLSSLIKQKSIRKKYRVRRINKDTLKNG